MFSLIITVISIALVAALAVASVYYGGPALSKGTAKASAATVVSQGQQISGAATLYASDHGGVTTPNLVGTVANSSTDGGLVIDDYLTSVPALPAAIGSTNGWVLGTGETAGFLVVDDAGAGITDICLAVEQNRDSSVSAVPAFAGGTIAAADLKGQFGCLKDAATATKHVLYYSL